MRTTRTLAIAICCLTLNTQAQILKEQLWHIVSQGSFLYYESGDVHTVVEDTVNDIIYVGGSFSNVGPPVNNGVILDQVSGLADLEAPEPNDEVRACIPDGEGGWYIGGAFTAIGDITRNGLARLNADGSVHAFNPGANGTVNTLYLDGNTLYVGGVFSSIGGAARSNVAAVDITTGDATAWSPSANGLVWSLAVSGSIVYIGGDFDLVGGLTRNKIAALDISTGAPTAWDPNANDNVRALSVNGNTVRAVGYFTNIGGELRNRIAALDVTTGNATAWDPNADAPVVSLLVDGDVVYVGGAFDYIGGQPRMRIAALDATTGDPTSWAPGVDAPVLTMALGGDTLYIGGYFSSVAGTLRCYSAAVDVNTGDLTSWYPDILGTVYCLALSDGSIYAGGIIRGVNYQPRNNLAAFDANTGMLLAWDPDPDATVTALAQKDNILYVGGHFSSIGGQSRNKLAAFDVTTGLATSWDPEVVSSSFGSWIYKILPDEGIIYVSGHFAGVGGQARKNIAALNATTGLATGWNPAGDVMVYVSSMALSGSNLYVCGDFTTLGGQPRNRLAALNVTTALATPWDPNANDLVRTLVVSGSTVYAGGDFTAIGGAIRNRLAALDATTGIASLWDPNANDDVTTLALEGNTLFVGGGFTSIGGQARDFLASVDVTSGEATAWDPDPTGSSFSAIRTLSIYGNTLYAGGSFGSIVGAARPGFAGFALCTEGSTCDADPAPGQYLLGQYDAICNCVPTLCFEDLVIEFQTDGNGEQVSWEITPQGSDLVICSGEGLPDNSVITTDCCVSQGCFKFTVYDSAGDGMTTGGYILRTAAGDRIIDNRNNFSTGFVSSISGPQSFCTPMGTDRLVHSSCDKLHWDNNQFIVASLNPAVSAEYLPGQPNSAQDTDSGYMFWFYDPNGSYSYVHFRTHATSHGYPASGPSRAAHLRINNWAPMNHLPVGVLLNVRVRGVLNGNWMQWGPACRFKLDPVAAACPPTKLIDIPYNTFVSCGQTREFAPGSYVHAIPVSGATQYQFRFRQPAEGFTKTRTTSSYFAQLWWAVAPLIAGSQYEVDVRARVDGNWCDWGEVCILNIIDAPGLQGGSQNSILISNATSEATLNMWPNPNNGDQLFISLSEVPAGTLNVSVEMFDLFGKRVLARQIATNDGFVNTVLDLQGELAVGMYMVNIIAGDRTWTRRLVVQP